MFLGAVLVLFDLSVELLDTRLKAPLDARDGLLEALLFLLVGARLGLCLSLLELGEAVVAVDAFAVVGGELCHGVVSLGFEVRELLGDVRVVHPEVAALLFGGEGHDEPSSCTSHHPACTARVSS